VRALELDGIQLTKLLRGKLREIDTPAYAKGIPVLEVPIFFVTAYGERYPEDELLAAGGTGVFHKPVDFAKVMANLTRSLLRGVGLSRA
jgi:CheY-like chemotaxis protein